MGAFDASCSKPTSAFGESIGDLPLLTVRLLERLSRYLAMACAAGEIANVEVHPSDAIQRNDAQQIVLLMPCRYFTE